MIEDDRSCTSTRDVFGPKSDEVRGDCIMEASLSVLLTEYYAGGHIKNSDLGRASGVCGEGGEVPTGFGWGNLRERDHFENLDNFKLDFLKYDGSGLD